MDSQHMALIFSIFPLIGLVLLFVRALVHVRMTRFEGKRIHRGSVGWFFLFVIGVIFLLVTALRGRVSGTPILFIANVVAFTASGAFALSRWRWFEFFDKLHDSSEEKRVQSDLLIATRDTVFIFVAALLTVIAMELPWNAALLLLPWRYALMEFAVVLAALAILYFITQRRGFGAAVGIGAFILMGTAQHYVIEFKSCALLPTDLLSLNTAAAVADNYLLTLSSGMMASFTVASAAIFLMSLIRPPHTEVRRTRAVRGLLNLFAATVVAIALTFFVTVPDYIEDADVSIDYWRTIDSYSHYGFAPAFITIAQSIPVQQPAGYSDEVAQEIIATHAKNYDKAVETDEGRKKASAQFEEIQPSVVVIMNETYSDISIYDRLGIDYAGIPVFDSIDDTLAKGELAVSVMGAGTCNTEFEFLTGNSLAYVGAGKYPYSLYNFTDVHNLAEQFNNMGYTTTAVHPNWATNWNRDIIYDQMGFDQFLSLDAFENAPTLRDWVTDAATYDVVIDQLKNNDEPQFIFDVTMMNHGGYTTGLIPEDEKVHYHVDELEPLVNEKMNEYIASMNRSDKELGYLLEELKKLDRPVVVVFFGDHQPSFSLDINETLYTDDERSIDHMARMYHTSYFIWANYDVAGRTQASTHRNSSASNLATFALDLVGAPLTDFQKVQARTRGDVPALMAYGYMGGDWAWYDFNETTSFTTSLSDLETAQYYMFTPSAS